MHIYKYIKIYKQIISIVSMKATQTHPTRSHATRVFHLHLLGDDAVRVCPPAFDGSFVTTSPCFLCALLTMYTNTHLTGQYGEGHTGDKRKCFSMATRSLAYDFEPQTRRPMPSSSLSYTRADGCRVLNCRARTTQGCAR